LKILKINIRQHYRLTEFEIPDGCRVYLQIGMGKYIDDMDDMDSDVILETFRKNNPGVIVDIAE
jgi:hypothetical protein